MVIITKNEEKNIRRCLESVRWADEIVLVDSGSTDRTLDIAREYTDRIYHQDWLGFGPQKNVAVSKATCDWVLYMEADEWATPALKEEVEQMLSSRSAYNAYAVSYVSSFRGRFIQHGGFRHRVIRLFRRGKGGFRPVLRHARPEVQGPVGRLHAELVHCVDESIWQYFVRRNNHTWMEAEQAFRKGERVTLSKLLLKPLWKFVWRYFFKLGFLDGVPGLFFCVIKAFGIYLKYALLWELYDGGWTDARGSSSVHGGAAFVLDNAEGGHRW
ncbi:MAG: glycosyltransferase family 2 protein [Abditibacteriales bacterium]|nr:glycosyltransferase family 2 protein [Abditibacteriales bacterium]